MGPRQQGLGNAGKYGRNSRFHKHSCLYQNLETFSADTFFSSLKNTEPTTANHDEMSVSYYLGYVFSHQRIWLKLY